MARPTNSLSVSVSVAPKLAPETSNGYVFPWNVSVPLPLPTPATTPAVPKRTSTVPVSACDGLTVAVQAASAKNGTRKHPAKITPLAGPLMSGDQKTSLDGREIPIGRTDI